MFERGLRQFIIPDTDLHARDIHRLLQIKNDHVDRFNDLQVNVDSSIDALCIGMNTQSHNVEPHIIRRLLSRKLAAARRWTRAVLTLR